MVLKILLFMA